MLLAKVHYLFLAPLIVLGLVSLPVLGETVLGAAVVVAAGLSGTILGRKGLVLIASAGLLLLLVSGKVALDLFRVGSQDTAVLLVEFGMVLFFMEAALVVADYDKTKRDFEGKGDEMSQVLVVHLGDWLRNLLSRQGKIALGSIGLSILLVPLAGFTSISSGQLPLTGALVLIAIVALLFLVTHRREPERKNDR